MKKIDTELQAIREDLDRSIGEMHIIRLPRVAIMELAVAYPYDGFRKTNYGSFRVRGFKALAKIATRTPYRDWMRHWI